MAGTLRRQVLRRKLVLLDVHRGRSRHDRAAVQLRDTGRKTRHARGKHTLLEGSSQVLGRNCGEALGNTLWILRVRQIGLFGHVLGN
jgi:hypothetical protein